MNKEEEEEMNHLKEALKYWIRETHEAWAYVDSMMKTYYKLEIEELR